MKMKIFAVALIAFVLGSVLSFPMVMAQERNGVLCAAIPIGNCIEAWNGTDITVYSGEASGETFSVEGSAGDVMIDGTFNVDDTLTTISGATTVTPANTILTVAPTVVSTITLATGSASQGDFLLVLNTVATNTNIADTGATAGGASIDLGVNDIAFFIFLNTKWVEIASPDNS